MSKCIKTHLFILVLNILLLEWVVTEYKIENTIIYINVSDSCSLCFIPAVFNVFNYIVNVAELVRAKKHFRLIVMIATANKLFWTELNQPTIEAARRHAQNDDH